MEFILFFWLTTRIAVPVAVEFNTRQACIEAGKALQGEWGTDARFMCLEKGDPKKKKGEKKWN